MRLRSRERWVIHGLLAAAVLLVVVSLGMTIGRDLLRSMAPRAEAENETSSDGTSVAEKSLPPLPELDLPPAVIPPAAADSSAPAPSPVIAPPTAEKPAPQRLSDPLRAALTPTIAGLWKISVPSGGYTHHPSVVLEQKGTEITGTYTSDDGQTAKVEKAKVSGDKLSFYVAHEQQGQPMKCWFEGTLKKDSWLGEVNYELGGAKGRLKFEAVRETGRVAETGLNGGGKPATPPSQQAGAGSSKPASAPPDKSAAKKNADPFRAGSVWVNDDASLTLTVLERRGETFRGKLVFGDSIERTFKGTVKEGKVSWLAKDVKAAKGGQGGDNTGTIQGDQIDFEYSTGKGKGKFTLRRKNSKTASRPSAQGKTAKPSSKKTAERSRKESKSEASAAALVTVDFHKPVRNVKSMSGFLHAINATQPSDQFVDPLRPASWRIIPASKAHERLAKKNVTLILVLSDTWGYKDKTPIRDYQAWEAHVRKVARNGMTFQYERDKKRQSVWDIWNEPDHRDFFWRGTFEEFLETFVRAARALREELGSETLISGPSLTNYNVLQLTQFLNHCKAHDVRIDVLSWHELGVDGDIPSVTEHLRDARKRFQQNQAYVQLGIKKLQVNEIIGPTAKYRPGEILGYLHALEAGGADAACKSCWPDSDGISSCFNFSLDGILTPKTFEPRAAWWAYKHYADSVATRVRSTSSDIRLPTFASRAEDGDKADAPARLLIGYYAFKKSPNVMTARLQLRG
jgi:hypothetical protein